MSITYEEYLDQYKQGKDYADLQSGHNSQLGALDKTYQDALSAYESTYNQGVAQKNAAKQTDIDLLTKNRDYSAEQLKGQMEEAQRQAYIGSMLAKRNLPASLSAAGITGGGSESAMMDLQRNYENNRNANDKTYQTETGALNQAYNNNLANTNKTYATLLDELMGQFNANKTGALNTYNQNKLSALDAFNTNLYNRAQSGYQNELARLAQEEAQRQWQAEFDLQQRMYEEEQARMNSRSSGGGGSSRGSGSNTGSYYLNQTGKYYNSQEEARQALKEALAKEAEKRARNTQTGQRSPNRNF